MKTANNAFRIKVAEAIAKKGLTISEVARTINFSRAGLSNYLRGDKDINTSTLEKLYGAVKLKV